MKLRLAKGASSTLILAHGAGAGSSHPWMVRYAEGLVARGIHVVTFDFPYVLAGKKAPDPAPRLEAAYRAVVAEVRADTKLAGCKLFLGGKSMGGRMASPAKGEACDGLVFFGYPLHPPAKPAQRRDAHLPKITAPMLFVQGARDAFGTEDELVPLVAALGKLATLFVVPWGDHSLAVPKKSGKTQDEVDAGVQDAVAAWMRER